MVDGNGNGNGNGAGASAIWNDTILWYGVGDNWNLYTATESSLIYHWQTYIDTVFTPWGFNVARLEGSFGPPGQRPEVYFDERLESLLDLLDSHGIKAVIDLHNWEEAGGQRWKDQWIQFVKKWKNDPRIVGYELFNEPLVHTWASNINNGYDLAQAFADLTDKIRAIDSTTKIVWADPYYFGQKTYDREYPVPLPAEAVRPNIVFAVHAWFWGYDGDDYTDYDGMLVKFQEKIHVMTQWKELYPDATMWLGEFGVNKRIDHPVQREFTIKLIDWCWANKVGFSLWYLRSVTPMYNEILEESNYGKKEVVEGFKEGASNSD